MMGRMTRSLLLLIILAMLSCDNGYTVEGDLSADDVRTIQTVISQMSDGSIASIDGGGGQVRVTMNDGTVYTLRQFEGRWIQADGGGKTIFD